MKGSNGVISWETGRWGEVVIYDNEQGEKKMEHRYQEGQLVRVIRCNCSHHFRIGETVRIKEVCNVNYLAEKLDSSDNWYVMWDEIEPIDEKEDKVDTIINAAKLLELNACEDGFKWFVDKYGKNDVRLSELDKFLTQTGHVVYRKWLHEKFPQLKKKERTFKVGDKFEWKSDGDIFVLAKFNGGVTLFDLDGTEETTASVVKVGNCFAITEEELLKIKRDMWNYFKKP